jgi:hypothetical protein
MFCHNIVIVLIPHSRSYTRSNHVLPARWKIRCGRRRECAPRPEAARAAGSACPGTLQTRRVLAFVGLAWSPADDVGGSSNRKGRHAAQPPSDRKAPRSMVANPEAHTPPKQQCPYQSSARSESNQFPRTDARDLSKLVRTLPFSQYVESPFGYRPNRHVSLAVDLV